MSIKQFIHANQKILKLMERLFEERHIEDPSQIAFSEIEEYTSKILDRAIANHIIPHELSHATAEAFIVVMFMDISKYRAHR